MRTRLRSVPVVSCRRTTSVELLGALLVVLATACGGDDGPGTPDAAPAPDARPPLDPALFDCTSVAGGLPARASTVPIACALDPACLTTQVSGHRGAGGNDLGALAPEDSLAAYRAAIALGVEFVETDPRPTADGVIVNMHDTDVDRTTDGTGAVDAMTFAEIRALNLDATKFPGDFSCERVPTLVEILETCRGRVVVLIDANKTDRVDLLVQAVRDADAFEWAVFDTSSVAKIDEALLLEPGLHFMNRPQTVDEITMQFDHFAPLIPVIVELDAATRGAGCAMVHNGGSRCFSDVFVEDILAITAGDSSGYQDALGQGVDILQSDRADLILEFLGR